MSRPSRRFQSTMAGTALLIGSALGAGAFELPAVNLGFTSFLDGGPPAGPGWYYTQYFQAVAKTELVDRDGDPLALPSVFRRGAPVEPDLEAFISLSQIIYQSDQAVDFLGGGKWGVDLIIPAATIDLDPSDGIPLRANDGGLGDVLVGPFLQWDPIMGDHGPLFMHRLELQTIWPTGKYDEEFQINPGSNHFSFNPYWAATWFPASRCSVSWRAHYLYNAENDEPNQVSFPGAGELKPGQAVHINFASSYELIAKSLRVGVNGYYLKQITESQIDGNDIPDSEEQVLGIGPGALWHFSPDTHFFLNAYFETAGENRPEGERLNLRLVHHF